MLISAYSKALYSSWIYLSSIRTLCDCGEGINTHLEGKLISIRNILLTHGHSDHFTGLQNVLVTKFRHTSLTGEKYPLKIFYPKNDRGLKAYINYLDNYYDLSKNRSNGIELISVEPGKNYEMNGKRDFTIEVFKTIHGNDVNSVGYNIRQSKRKLCPEFTELTQEEIKAKILQGGKDSITYVSNDIMATYIGDSKILNPELFMNTELLIHEATFLEGYSDKDLYHCTVKEALKTAGLCNAKNVLLFHFSTRFTKDNIEYEISKFKNLAPAIEKIHYVYPGWEFNLNIEKKGRRSKK